MTPKPPNLRITITKRRGKRPLIICDRPDGTQTMAELSVGAEHDLCHFVVETTLGYRNAFYGQLAGGRNIEDFNVPAATTRIDIPEEAIATEFIVKLLQMELAGGAAPADFNGELQRAMANARKPLTAPRLSDGDVAAMRRQFAEFVGRWRRLPEGQSIELIWPG